MAQDSKIEWTEHTANLWHGCTKVHAGCDNCYAETLSHRWGNDLWGNDKPRKEIKSVWADLAKFQKLAATAGTMHRVFVGSMMDIFEKPMPLVNNEGTPAIDASDGSPVCTDWLRDRLFNEVIPNSPNLLFLLLTKRPSNINKYIPEKWKENPPVNVMFGTSPVDQETADKLIPQLLTVTGHKFLSIEPQLGPIDLNINVDPLKWSGYNKLNVVTGFLSNTYRDSMNANPIGTHIEWIINGGESGHNKRPYDPNWGRSLRNQCISIPFFMKQWDKIKEIPEDLLIRENPEKLMVATNSVHYCENCRQNTNQKKVLYNPDEPESGMVWQCNKCLENIGWAE